MEQNISFERPFTYVFKDPRWLPKVLVGALVSMLIVVLVGAFVLLGYQKRLFRTLVQDPAAPLPEIDFGGDLVAGLPLFAIQMCYLLVSLPLLIVPFVGFLAVLGVQLIVLPVATMRFYTTERFGAAFELGEIVAFVKAHLNNLVVYAAIALLAGTIASLGLIACVVGVFFTGFFSKLVTTCALADVWRCSTTLPSPADEPPSPRR